MLHKEKQLRWFRGMSQAFVSLPCHLVPLIGIFVDSWKTTHVSTTITIGFPLALIYSILALHSSQNHVPTGSFVMPTQLQWNHS